MNVIRATSDSASRTLLGATLKSTRLFLSAYVFGACASWMLIAFIFVQFYTYHRRWEFKTDCRYIWIIVHALVLLQICQTTLDSMLVYRLTVYGWGDPEIDGDVMASSLNNLLPLMDSLTGIVVQYFYLSRIWTLGTVMFDPATKLVIRCLCLLFGSLPLLSCGSALALFILLNFTTLQASNQYIEYVAKLTLTVWAVPGAIVDTAITICMIIILYHAKSAAHFKGTRGRISKILRATIQTGFITASLAVLAVIFQLGVLKKVGTFFLFPQFLLGKSYVISFLSILNARVSQCTVVRGSGVTDTNPNLFTSQLTPLAFTQGRTPVHTDLETGRGSRGLGRALRSISATISNRSSGRAACNSDGESRAQPAVTLPTLAFAPGFDLQTIKTQNENKDRSGQVEETLSIKK